MTDYLDFRADLDDPRVVEAFDDFTFWSSMFGQLLFRHLPLAPGLRVLDVGCGPGFPLLELADRLGPQSSVHGIDTWAPAVERARLKARVRQHGNVHVTLGDAARMPFEDHSFDLIVSNLGLNNFAAPEAVMSECHRVCDAEGRVALTTNLVGHMSELYAVFEATLGDVGRDDLVAGLHEHIAHRATLDGLSALFEGASFEVTNVHTETFTLTYADGSSLLRAYLIRLGFLDGWRGVLGGIGDERAFFERLEERLNEEARGVGLSLTIPAAYVEARPAPAAGGEA